MTILQKIIAFHKDLINTQTPTSSRRYLAITFAYSVLFTAFVDMFFKLTMTQYIFMSLCTMTLVFSGLAAWGSNNSTNAKSDVASDVVKSDASVNSNQVAKDIIKDIKES